MRVSYQDAEQPVEVYVPPEIFRDKVQMRLKHGREILDVTMSPDEARQLASELYRMAIATDNAPEPKTFGEMWDRYS